VDVKLWVADWFAMMNNKFGGDLGTIRTCGEYFIHVWRALGLPVDEEPARPGMGRLMTVWSSEAIGGAEGTAYWETVMDIARRNSVTRIGRCGMIMGRKDGADLSAAQIMYPCMQCADIFFLKADICQLGLDQRKVNMLALEYVQQVDK
ncbi:aminoacyl-tRNA synthetase, class Ic, partial [Kipferlia bialata]